VTLMTLVLVERRSKRRRIEVDS